MVASEDETQQKGLFGLAKGFPTILGTEFAERFSYYGMKAILLYYIINTAAQGGLGLPRADGVAISSLYGALIYMSTILGGWLSDRIFGSARIVTIGGVFILAGHIVLALPFGEAALLGSLALLIIGTGMLKPNVSTLVGSVVKDDKDANVAFSLFYVAINIGGFLSPIVVSTLQTRYGFHIAFSAAAIVMGIGLAIYSWGYARYLRHNITISAPNPIKKSERAKVLWIAIGLVVLGVVAFFVSVATKTFSVQALSNLVTIAAVLLTVYYFTRILTSKLVTSGEKRKVVAYIPVFMSGVALWAVQEGGGTIVAEFVTRSNHNFVGFKIADAMIQSINPFVVVFGTAIMAVVYKVFADKLPNLFQRYAIGIALVGVSYLLLLQPAMSGNGFSANWIVLSLGVVAFGEVLISPISLAVTNRLAPKAFESQMMAIWFLSNSVGQGLNASLSGFYLKHTALYFGIYAAVPLLFGVALIMFSKQLTAMIGED
ncbi:peptide MFS transporter [Lactococcus paracarnosus]|uniref:MFS transporter n=1 Tax=Pseudolactococcus paracarnosus TaxID=2749962 RepID=A0ABT0AP90_9LACT|nr:oligopeptide:H+ symporter [Lactococcus paracarnosus]MCJ1978389.1 MFS transporter [Lactococcus paracarnosus]MCJ1984518.1 MFS transporter [Lactococcus paracarnosus]MCJ1998985.1 MFS transporter [Lactococcus paracarnosus]